MPGDIGTSIVLNSAKVLRGRDVREMTAEEVAAARERMRLADAGGQRP